MVRHASAPVLAGISVHVLSSSGRSARVSPSGDLGARMRAGDARGLCVEVRHVTRDTSPPVKQGFKSWGPTPTSYSGGVAESYYRAVCMWGRGLWPRPRVQSAPAGALPSVHQRSSGSMGVPSSCGLGGHAEAGLVQRKIVPEPLGGSLTTHQSGSPFLFPDTSLPLPPPLTQGFVM